jgi:sugar phosphate permease
MGNWFSKKNRGLFMGIWSGNSNVGNILGYYIGHIVSNNLNLSW